MKFHAVCLAVAVSCLASTAAIATSQTRNSNHPVSREGWSERCAKLDEQFDNLIDKYKGSPTYEAAYALHTDGIAACAANETGTGVIKLEQALKKLGVEPAS